MSPDSKLSRKKTIGSSAFTLNKINKSMISSGLCSFNPVSFVNYEMMSCENRPLMQNFEDPAEKLGTRHVQIFLIFLGIVVAYSMRACMSVTIVAMTDAKSANPNFYVCTLVFIFFYNAIIVIYCICEFNMFLFDVFKYNNNII
jgi:magnesium-transporting ATPase (P-type)